MDILWNLDVRNLCDLLKKADQYVQENKDRVVELWRLKYHLTGACGWINDPNGFVLYKGVYHLLYQHYPFDAVWGPMYWGHATSSDLVDWTLQPIALAPDMPYDRDGCFSGSSIAVEGKLHLFYTGHVWVSEDKTKYEQTQCLAISSDGIHFKKYEHNPIIGQNEIPSDASRSDFRDPKVIMRDGIYYMLVGSMDTLGLGQILLYKSQDLKNWKFVNILLHNDGTVGRGTWECPDLFSLGERDVLIFSPQFMQSRGYEFKNLHSAVYWVGYFNIEKGIFEGGEPIALDSGFDFYAPQVLVDERGRRILTAWMDMWESPMPTADLGHNWAGAMVLPREIILAGDKLHFKPIDEIENYRSNEFTLENVTVKGEYILPVDGDCYELDAEFVCIGEDSFGLKVRTGAKEETVLRFIPEENLFEFNRNHSGKGSGGVRQTKVDIKNKRLQLRVFVDKSSVEVFVNHGEKVLSGRIYPDKNSKGIVLFSDGRVHLDWLKKWDLMKFDNY